MSEATIRPAVEEDQQTIKELIREAKLDPTGLHWSHFLMAELDDRVVGLGQIRPKTPELGSLYVLPEYQGQGIAGRLVVALLERTPGTMYLECRGYMAPYYERFGFVKTRWQEIPGPLRIKSMVGSVLGRLLGMSPTVMVRRAESGSP